MAAKKTTKKTTKTTKTPSPKKKVGKGKTAKRSPKAKAAKK